MVSSTERALLDTLLLEPLAELPAHLAPAPAAEPLDDFGRLQALLLGTERRRAAALEARVLALEAQLAEGQALLALLAPVLSDAIARCVRDSRDEMAEALYPVIGRSVGRAVQEAMRDLAQRIDTTMRRSLQPRFVRNISLRLRGLDPEAATLRSVRPFPVSPIFLIPPHSGLLVAHLDGSEALADADIIGGMLAAIRSYVQDSFAPNANGSLDAIGYGDLRIVIEEGSSVVLAVVVQGVEQASFRNRLRQQLSALQAACGPELRAFCGDPIAPRLILPALQPLLENRDDPA